MLPILTLLTAFTPSAHATCTLGSLTPATGTVLTDKTSFRFAMSADCVEPNFEVLVSPWTQTPQVERVVGGQRVMVVLPTPADWAQWTAESRTTITWRVTATDINWAATTPRTAVAQLDLDGDGVTRSDGDCDDDDAAAVGNDGDEDCDGVFLAKGTASPLTGEVGCADGYAVPQCSWQGFDASTDLAWPGNGIASAAVTKDVVGGFETIHAAEYLNDGRYGNGASWVSARRPDSAE